MLFSFTCILYICSAEIAALAIYVLINTLRKENGSVRFAVADERGYSGYRSFMLDDSSLMHQLHFEVESLRQQIVNTERELNDPSITLKDADLLRNKLNQSRDELGKALKFQSVMSVSKPSRFMNDISAAGYNALSGRSQQIWN